MKKSSLINTAKNTLKAGALSIAMAFASTGCTVEDATQILPEDPAWLQDPEYVEPSPETGVSCRDIRNVFLIPYDEKLKTICDIKIETDIKVDVDNHGLREEDMDWCYEYIKERNNTEIEMTNKYISTLGRKGCVFSEFENGLRKEELEEACPDNLYEFKRMIDLQARDCNKFISEQELY